jgi:hypothetical protein
VDVYLATRFVTCGFDERIGMDLTTYATLKKRSILNRKAEPPTARLGRIIPLQLIMLNKLTNSMPGYNLTMTLMSLIV